MRARFLSMTTRRRLTIGAGVGTVLMLLAAGLGLARLDELNGQVSEVATHEAPKLKLAQDILGQANAINRITFDLVLAPESRHEELLQRIQSKRSEITEKLAALTQMIDEPESQALLKEMRQRRDAYVASYGAVLERLKSGHRAEALRILTDETLGRIERFNEALDTLVVHEVSELQRNAATTNREVARDQVLLIAFVLFGLSVATVFALWIIRSVVEPLGGEPEDAKQAALTIAAGDLDGDIRVREDDTQSLMAAMKTMQQNMRQMVARLNDNARHLRALNARLEERVRERTAQLEVSNTELESMSFAVAHDLRQPLRAIEGFSKVLNADCTEKLDIECRDHATRIANGVRRMNEMIDSMMGLVRISRSDFVRQTVDVSALARSVADELFMLEPKRQAEILVDDGMQIEADAALVRGILQNLIANAWKFTRTRERARIQVGCHDEAGRRVFYVRDNGVGFNMEHASRLFAPFQRFHTHEAFEGHGVGLANVHRAVRRHEGHVWAQSEPGQGATFFFVLEGNGESPNRGPTALEPCENGA
jgi:signal transduction histidine kinase